MDIDRALRVTPVRPVVCFVTFGTSYGGECQALDVMQTSADGHIQIESKGAAKRLGPV